MKIRLTLHRPLHAARRGVQRARAKADSTGMATAEYAIGLVGACGFAGILVAIMRSPEMKALLFGIIKKALNI